MVLPLLTRGQDPRLFVEDVFATTLYTGNGSTQTITNGLNLSGAGGLVWLKGRNGASSHSLMDSLRSSFDLSLSTNNTDAESSVNRIDPTSTGFTLNTAGYNGLGDTFVAWSFARAARFFDAFAYNGSDANAGNNYRISHNLGITPGLVICKRRDATTGNAARDGWQVWHRSLSGFGGRLQLESTAAEAATPVLTNATSTYIEFDNSLAYAKESGINYVAYLFAHDPDPNGIVQCGSFTTDGSGNAAVNLGWEPQWLMTKVATNPGFGTNWDVYDTMRGFVARRASGNYQLRLNPNANIAETSDGQYSPTSTGFEAHGAVASSTIIYLAIRRGPMRQPQSGGQIYNVISRNGTGSSADVGGAGFPPDALLVKRRDDAAGWLSAARLIGSRYMGTSSAAAEDASSPAHFNNFTQDGYNVGTGGTTNSNPGSPPFSTYVNYFFRRFPGAFDITVAQGTSTGVTNWPHALGVTPAMIWRKSRTNSYNWQVWHESVAGNGTLNSSSAWNTGAGLWQNSGSTNMTATTFSTGASAEINSSADSFVTYLFGKLPGICGGFTYSGSASPVTVNLGFTPRFIIVKRTDSTGGWHVFDTTRGIVAGNDPYLLLNSTAAEVTSADAIDPTSGGFIVNNVTAELNTSGGTYVGWACS